jgi:phosphoserine phosphatase RsbU/P
VATLAQDVTIASQPTMPRILIADDQPDVLEALRLLLKRHSYEVATVASPTAILEALGHSSFDLLLMDLNYARDTTSGREGLDLLARLNELADTPPVVVMTGWGSVGLAVEAMQRGVGDFVEKPWENARLLEILGKQVALGRSRREARRLETEQHLRSDQMARELHEKDQEIEEARQIQQGFLPKEIPQIEGFEIAGAWQAARIVGGDYFDVMKFDERSLALCIADVAGKGIPAALLMSNLQATVRGFAGAAISPKELCEKVNSSIARNIAADRFITFFYGLLDARTRRLQFSNAGHNPPIHLHRDGSITRLREGGDVLGVFSNCIYERSEVVLAPGDRLALFTDGLTEASNAAGEEFGESRLIELLVANRTIGAAALQKRILDAVTEFCGGDFADDATLIVLAVTD